MTYTVSSGMLNSSIPSHTYSIINNSLQFWYRFTEDDHEISQQLPLLSAAVTDTILSIWFLIMLPSHAAHHNPYQTQFHTVYVYIISIPTNLQI